MNKLKLAVGYGSICGGCDVAFTDIGTKLAELSKITEIVYWPAVMDGKLKDLKEIPEIDVGIFFGAIRTEEHEKMAKILENKADILIGFGACSSYGGIPGLGNVETKDTLLNTAHLEAPNTEAEGIPSLEKMQNGELALPELENFVSSPPDVVDFNILVPGCPPPVESVEDLLKILKDYQEGHQIPEDYVLAESRSLCDYCEREKPENLSIDEIKRIHEAEVNDEDCLLEQGILCLGPVTRGGCGARCIEKNMPCRGCFGPTPNIRDQGTKYLSSIASAIKSGKEKEVGQDKLEQFIEENIPDPVGLFYRFALAVAILNRVKGDKK